jgi:ribosomal protein L40E
VADYVDKRLRKVGISISKPVLALMCILSGLMVILAPSLLGVWFVGLFLVSQGALVLADHFEQERRMATTPTSDGFYCRNCGAGNTKEAAYCIKCGKELVQTGLIVTTRPQEVTQQS